MKDEYGRIFEFVGHRFVYEHGDIGESKPISQRTAKSIGQKKSDGMDAPSFVYCRLCRTYMDYDKSGLRLEDGDSDGLWTCPGCGAHVSRQRVLDQYQTEIDLEEAKWSNDYDDIW